MFLKSLSSPTPSMLRRTFLAVPYIHTNYTPQQFLANCIGSSIKIMIIPLNSKNVPVASNRDSTKTSTKTLNHSTWPPPSLAKYLGTIVGNWIAMTSSSNGKWLSKHQIKKEDNFLTYLTMILTLSNQLILEVDLGCKSSVIPICYALTWQGPSPIMLLLESTD